MATDRHDLMLRLTDAGFRWVLDRAHHGVTRSAVAREAMAFIASRHQAEFDKYLDSKRVTF